MLLYMQNADGKGLDYEYHKGVLGEKVSAGHSWSSSWSVGIWS